MHPLIGLDVYVTIRIRWNLKGGRSSTGKSDAESGSPAQPAFTDGDHRAERRQKLDQSDTVNLRECSACQTRKFLTGPHHCPPATEASHSRGS